MGNSCSQSSDCQTSGECCSIQGTCSAKLECDVSDERFQVGAMCVQHSDCATGCCDDEEGICTNDRDLCPDVPNPHKKYYLIGLFGLAFIVLMVSLLIIYIKQRRKRFKMEHQIDPRHTSQIPIAEPLDSKIKVKRIPVARRVKKSQVRYNTEVPPPVVEVASSSKIPQIVLARKVSRKGNLTQ